MFALLACFVCFVGCSYLLYFFVVVSLTFPYPSTNPTSISTTIYGIASNVQTARCVHSCKLPVLCSLFVLFDCSFCFVIVI